MPAFLCYLGTIVYMDIVYKGLSVRSWLNIRCITTLSTYEERGVCLAFCSMDNESACVSKHVLYLGYMHGTGP